MSTARRPAEEHRRPTERIRGFVRDNALGLAFLAGFLVILVGQAFAGCADFNDRLAVDGLAQLGLWQYVTSSDFAVDVTENWQSEYLQFFLYITATIWLLQRGSPESKKPGTTGTGTDQEQRVRRHAASDSPSWARAGGWRLGLYSRSLGLVMGTVFVLSWLAQSVTGTAAANEERLRELRAPTGWSQYVASADFWNRTLQNWQSELLAIASMAILAIYLRQRGSPESKPVGASHAATGVEAG